MSTSVDVYVRCTWYSDLLVGFCLVYTVLLNHIVLLMANKTRVSVTLDNELVKDLDNNNINKSKYINELLNKHRITTNYIESLGYKVDINEVVELGLEALKSKADKQRYLQQHTQAMSQPKQPKPNKNIAIRNAVGQCETWKQIVSALADDYDLSNIKGVNDRGNIDYSSMPYYYENRLVRSATDNKYGVNRQGDIVEA